MPLTTPKDQDIVLVGASGDLATKRLIPALYNLESDGLLPSRGSVVGVATNDWDDQDFRMHALKSVAVNNPSGIDDAVWDRFASRLRFVSSLGDGDTMTRVVPRLDQATRLVYFSIPPSAFEGSVASLGNAGLSEGTKLIIEKPFGHDIESARHLNQTIHQVIPEERVFRIDHYLGKETVQNLLVLRFANPLFERTLNNEGVQRVEITVAESVGVGRRGAFYEETGAIRDIVQNHVLQLLALVAMEAPHDMGAASIREEKAKLLNSVAPIDPAFVVRGQYTAGTIDGKKVPGYREESGVAEDSQTETYAAMRLRIDNWRWGGTRFLLRTGKRLARRETRVVVVFRDAPFNFFATTEIQRLVSQKLNIRIQPNEGISITFVLKEPGPVVATQKVDMDFSYASSFNKTPKEAYDRLLLEALLGDHTLFISESETERGWEIVRPVLEAPPPVVPYEVGSAGPAEAEGLVAPRRWHALED
ncbi:MAG: glucose-6-phosphate dehydrogenase [Candidatus Dormibacteraeota bacterium]|uniref:Glucose-6-phosphate 1-dehydrogenase n=1 Tax=Candidatus Amunia macphersoniae TaxID=3127014 RepID=A0A934KLX5_9BACT|nr:glucose-6-phosphate dehydrogenase [Candidatus Dormibacteraeota bacterium]